MMRMKLYNSFLFIMSCGVLSALAVSNVKSGELSMEIQPISETDNIRGLIKPSTTAILSSELQARITSIPFRDGQRFKKDEILIGFDCSLYHAELAAAKAEHNARLKKYENNKELLSLNAISNIEVEISEAEVEKAKADVQIASIRVSDCIIKAPYDGRVIELLVNEHESVPGGEELISILNDKELEIELIIPSKWLNWLSVADKFEFLVDETNKKYPAKVTRIGSSVDPVSQTIRVTGIFESLSEDILAGMSGTAIFEETQ